MMSSDSQLLQDYAQNKSQDAFTELVQRHLNLVYSAAFRQVRSSQLAEEISQSVFTDLARAADKLKPGILTAWLYQVTRRTAIDVIRRESRRQARERLAVEMAAMNTASDWIQIEPLLDEAMDALDETDRAAILLRYFENKSLREVGQTLGTSDDAAQKRVSRAVDRLREFLSRRGIAVGAAGLVAVVSVNAVHAAPAGLAVTISAAAVLTGATIQTSTAIAATKVIAMTTLQKALIGTTIAIVAGAGIYESRQSLHMREQIDSLRQQQAPLAAQIQQLKQERDEATNRVAALTDELARNQYDNTEVLKLRAEIATLRRQQSPPENSRPASSAKAGATQETPSEDLAGQLAAAIVQGDATALQRLREFSKSQTSSYITNTVGMAEDEKSALWHKTLGNISSAFNWLAEEAVSGNANARQAIDQAVYMKELQGFAVQSLGQLAGRGDDNALQILLNPDRYGFPLSSAVGALGPAAENGNQQAISMLATVLSDQSKVALWHLASQNLQVAAASGNSAAIEALKSVPQRQ